MDIALYIHIPFCKKKCNYCDFYSVPYEQTMADRFVRALCKEWSLAAARYFDKRQITITSVYCGGGTPSLLNGALWRYLAENLFLKLPLADKVEWTIECNPDSFDHKKALLWRALGVNRLSLGIQSLHDRELKLLGRPYLSARAREVLGRLERYKFTGVGADIIYGFYPQTLETLRQTVRGIAAYDYVNHLSAYELSLSPHTPLGRHPALYPKISNEKSAEFTKAMHAMLTEKSFIRYEVSNYAREGRVCRHNVAYWQGLPYLGLGPAAHSLIGRERFANTADLAAYGAMIDKGNLPVAARETRDRAALAREMIFLGLRRSCGINESDFLKRTGQAFYGDYRKPTLDLLRKKRLVRYRAPFWSLTDKGMLLADGIAAQLF